MLARLIKYFIRQVVGLLPGKINSYLYEVIREQNNLSRKTRNEIDAQIGFAIASVNNEQYDQAETHFKNAALLDPTNPNIAPHLSRARFLKIRSSSEKAKNEVRNMQSTLSAMEAELMRKSIYVPSEFWGTFGKFHIALLEKYGIENFKRTVSHNYQNWFMVNKNDSQEKALFEIWVKNLPLSLGPWFNTIEIPDHVGLHPTLSFDNPIYPLAYLEEREIYRITVGILWEYVEKNDQSEILKALSESEIGNPIRVTHNEKLISSDIAHSVRERGLLLENLSLKGNEALIVGELGAGHGRLAEIFGSTTNYRYFIFDITPALYVSQWYVKNLFPDAKIFEFRSFEEFSEIESELENCRFAFFTANQIEKLPSHYVDLFINLNSLTEMRIDQIENFLYQIDRLTRMAFLSRQWNKWVNPLDGHSVAKNTFRMNGGWALALDHDDEIYPDFFNQIWVKNSSHLT